MSKQDIIMQYINERLLQWARWYIYRCDFGLGYPRKSREGQLMDGGGLIIRSTNPYIPSNDLAEETEALIKELAGQNKNLATAIREDYFGEGNYMYKARRIGVPISYYKTYVESARQWLIGRLSIEKPWLK